MIHYLLLARQRSWRMSIFMDFPPPRFLSPLCLIPPPSSHPRLSSPRPPYYPLWEMEDLLRVAFRVFYLCLFIFPCPLTVPFLSFIFLPPHRRGPRHLFFFLHLLCLDYFTLPLSSLSFSLFRHLSSFPISSVPVLLFANFQYSSFCMNTRPSLFHTLCLSHAASCPCSCRLLTLSSLCTFFYGFNPLFGLLWPWLFLSSPQLIDSSPPSFQPLAVPIPAARAPCQVQLSL